jgi:uncharacterized protein YbjT (DUF2867 family)
LTRSPKKLDGLLPDGGQVEVMNGDLLRAGDLAKAMESVDTAYYLVHSMAEGREGFAERDRQAAENFVRASDDAGIERIIYLGGLGDREDKLSGHLSSRNEVAHILSSGRARATILRASIIIGAGGAPFEMLRYLVENLPVMVCPRWVHTRTQPIAVQNVIEYLLGCLHQPATTGMTFDIGGPVITSYIELMHIYARVRGLVRPIFTVPVLTPRLSSYWVELVTPVPPGIVRSLIEGLKNEATAKENRIREIIPTRLLTLEEAICTALVETKADPGKLGSKAECRIADESRSLLSLD